MFLIAQPQGEYQGTSTASRRNRKAEGWPVGKIGNRCGNSPREWSRWSPRHDRSASTLPSSRAVLEVHRMSHRERRDTVSVLLRSSGFVAFILIAGGLGWRAGTPRTGTRVLPPRIASTVRSTTRLTASADRTGRGFAMHTNGIGMKSSQRRTKQASGRRAIQVSSGARV